MGYWSGGIHRGVQVWEDMWVGRSARVHRVARSTWHGDMSQENSWDAVQVREGTWGSSPGWESAQRGETSLEVYVRIWHWLGREHRSFFLSSLPPFQLPSLSLPFPSQLAGNGCCWMGEGVRDCVSGWETIRKI